MDSGNVGEVQHRKLQSGDDIHDPLESTVLEQTKVMHDDYHDGNDLIQRYENVFHPVIPLTSQATRS